MKGLAHKVQLHQKYSDKGFEVITLFVEGEETLDAGQALLEQLKLSATTNIAIAEGLAEEALPALQMTDDSLLPTIHLYDRKGRLRYRLEGEIDEEGVERHIEELLSE